MYIRKVGMFSIGQFVLRTQQVIRGLPSGLERLLVARPASAKLMSQRSRPNSQLKAFPTGAF